MTTMTDSEALAVLDRMLGQALAFRESSSKTDGTKSEQYAEDCKAFAHIAEALRDAARYRWLIGSDGEGVRSYHIQEMWAKCQSRYPSASEWGAAIDAAIEDSK